MALVRKGIKTISDLVDIEGSIKNWQTTSKEFNLKGYLSNSSDSSVIESKIRMFQYKILNTVLYLNQRLSDMKIVGSSLFSQCKK